MSGAFCFGPDRQEGTRALVGPLMTASIPASDAELLRECCVDTFRAGGKGGQHQNTTDSAVRLTHLPTGIVVLARERRSQYRNRQVALARLRERLERHFARKPKRVPTRVPRGRKLARLEAKRRRSLVKRSRRKPAGGG